MQESMAQSTTPSALIDIELSITPSSHSFSQPSPPTITMKLTSHARAPITFFTWNTPLHLHLALSNHGITITDTTTGLAVPTTRIQIQRGAIRRIRGSSDAAYFITLEPELPVTMEDAFGRAANVQPQPKSIVQRGRELDDQGRERNIRRSTRATGVDGLEAGHEYQIGLNLEMLKACRWAYATKDDALVDHWGVGSYLRDFPWDKRMLEFRVEETTLSVVE
ncbi:hypothetical protein AUEXF2481DRAFT_704329 [Aureobasidium subglaciale EXF-2481]|uniref:Uncharacterized protein n=1 Tax=Aureobasidium subglaciale (strain EXF-2481) TaxID=1043005 RepID=A0A074Y882_AURSE|nr:uncharacterized protein AUEXF2481DRAFT_704329 [Aureobasidium subglaciale EXF-2481]KEQ90427.1 hypothetical protein AUEXF2481DRAFT_704329 [Aureobasidium subglaciale EXF-2481]